MGACQADSSFVAVWLNVGAASLLTLSKVVVARSHVESAFAEKALQRRLKLILNPVEVTLPFPAQGPRNACCLEGFFGKSASICQTRASSGAEVFVVQVDLFSKWILRTALQSVGFRPGNVVEFVVVDWEGKSLVAGTRLTVCDEFNKVGSMS